jgi:hypothetical protein
MGREKSGLTTGEDDEAVRWSAGHRKIKARQLLPERPRSVLVLHANELFFGAKWNVTAR